MIIDIHGHYTTAPELHNQWRIDQLAAYAAGQPSPEYPEISDEIGASESSEFVGTTIVNHLGIAACDLLLADLLLARAEERGIGTLLG